jgi:hypothetical protein
VRRSRSVRSQESHGSAVVRWSARALVPPLLDDRVSTSHTGPLWCGGPFSIHAPYYHEHRSNCSALR